MFKKLEISNVGRFKSSKTEGDEQFLKKNTYIYGKNTFGKSTLTAIFRSLKENKPDYVLGRKTIGAQKQVIKLIPEVTTPIGEYRYSTDEGRWSSPFRDTIIFDTHFIRESVYTQTQQIGPDQEKNIESFMLGAKGVEYNINIAKLIEKIGLNTTTQNSIRAEYTGNKHLLGGLSFDDFLALVEIKDIDKEIEKTQKELDTIKNAELISSKLGDIRDWLERYRKFDVANISEKLSVNSELITEHFNSHVNQKEDKQVYSSFLQTGSRLRSHGATEFCPFCTQEINEQSAKTFLETIDLIYNENYRNLQQAIKSAETLFSKTTFVTQIEKIKIDLKQAGYEIRLDFSVLENNLEEFGKSIVKKKENLADDFDATALTAICEEVTSHTEVITTELEEFQNPAERKAELAKTMDQLVANKERFGSWKEKCGNYIQAKADSKPLSTEKTKLWNEYKAYANGLSATMLADMNAVLSAANCDFTIQTFSFKGNQRQDLLVLAIGNSQISNDGQDHEMTIKNCLSDSDKWILALAFFLATVKNDPAVKVVVMDDPVSSFDVDRKRIITKEIQRVLAATDKQLILLTHEKGFYHLLHSENRDANSAFLKISFHSQDGSDLVACNPSEDPEFMSDYNCWITDMKSARDSHDISLVKSAHAFIRPVIEYILKSKYPLELTPEIHTVGEMLKKLEEPNGSYSVTSQRASIDTLLANEAHHDQSGNGQYPTAQLGIEDYKKDIRDAFNVIKSL